MSDTADPAGHDAAGLGAADTTETGAPATDTASHDLPMVGHLREWIAQDWDPAPPMPHPAGRPRTGTSTAGGAATSAVAPTAQRRAALSGKFPGRVLVIAAGTAAPRANDTDYAFRAASAFTWLTGETAADSVLVMTPADQGHECVLYVREYAQPGEVAYFTSRGHGAVWVGNVPSVEDTARTLRVPTRPLAALRDDVRHTGTDAVVLRGVDASVDAVFPRVDGTADADLAREIDELRLIKDSWELDRLRYACEITARGFRDVAGELPRVVGRADLRGERWLEGTFWRRARLEGNEVGYTSILGSGAHATTLHWWRNDGVISPGSLLLADMGVETDELYTADVTRTMPVDGVWTAAQRKVYSAVLEAQQAGIAEVKAGADFLAAHRAAMFVLADHLHSWGLLEVPAEVSCAEDPERPGAGAHRRFTLHGTSHMLGIDVHDCARARDEQYRDGTLHAGNVLTVEPGLYFQLNDRKVPAELRGIGVRIEDDIAVTDGAPVNLSAMLPREPDEVSDWLRDARADGGTVAGIDIG